MRKFHYKRRRTHQQKVRDRGRETKENENKNEAVQSVKCFHHKRIIIVYCVAVRHAMQTNVVIVRIVCTFFSLLFSEESEDKPHAFYFAKMKISNEKVGNFLATCLWVLITKAKQLLTPIEHMMLMVFFSACVYGPDDVSKNRIFGLLHTATCIMRSLAVLPMNKLLQIIKLQINGRVDIKQSVY